MNARAGSEGAKLTSESIRPPGFIQRSPAALVRSVPFRTSLPLWHRWRPQGNRLATLAALLTPNLCNPMYVPLLGLHGPAGRFSMTPAGISGPFRPLGSSGVWRPGGPPGMGPIVRAQCCTSPHSYAATLTTEDYAFGSAGCRVEVGVLCTVALNVVSIFDMAQVRI